MPTCVNISFMLLQGVLALKSFATALRFTDEPGISLTGFLMLFKAEHTGYRRRRRRRKKRKELCVLGKYIASFPLYIVLYKGYKVHLGDVCYLDSELNELWQREHWCALESPDGSSDSEQCKTLGKDLK